MRPILLILGTLAIAGCSSRFDVIPSELNGPAPKFELRDRNPLAGRAVQLNSFAVLSSGSDYSHPMWSVSLRPGAYLAVKQLRYGVVPQGFTEEAPAKQLMAGRTYQAVAFGAGSGGSVEFSLTR